MKCAGIITNYNTLEPMPHSYGVDYARIYLKTLMLPYTHLKNAFLAKELVEHIPSEGIAIDVGGNINAIRKGPSIRSQLDMRDYRDSYFVLDINQAFFNISEALVQEPTDEADYYPIGKRNGIVGDAYRLPLGPQTIDAVILADVLEYLQNPEIVISSLETVLKKGGQLMLVLPAMYKLDQFDLDEIHAARRTNHINFFSEQRTRELLSKEGFKIDEMKGLNYLDALPFLLWSDLRYVSRDQKERTVQEERFQRVRSLLTAFDRDAIDQTFHEDPKRYDDFRSDFVARRSHPLFGIAEITRYDPRFDMDLKLQAAYHEIRTILERAIEDSNFNSGWMQRVISMPNSAYLANSVFIRARKPVEQVVKQTDNS